MSETVANLIKSAIAALSQNATLPADVAFAKNRLGEALSQLTPRAPDVLPCGHSATAIDPYDNTCILCVCQAKRR